MTTTSTPTVIDEFRGSWAFLSNFHPAPLRWEGVTYPTSEHAFNAGKTLDMGRREWIAAAPMPGEAKRRGRSVQLRPGWDEYVRYRVMAEVLRAKFTCRQARVQALLSTGGATLSEGTMWHDNVWGDCRCGRPSCAEPGLNHLGRLLMNLRTHLARREVLPPVPAGAPYRIRQLRRFAMTPADYDQLLASQDGHCALCDTIGGQAKTPAGSPISLAVDHDHGCCPERGWSCGRCVRGLLCGGCNGLLGELELGLSGAVWIREFQPELAVKALAYVNGFRMRRGLLTLSGFPEPSRRRPMSAPAVSHS
ncbi:MAG TPA: NADAR domain-containing protein [Micromonospora sp.]